MEQFLETFDAYALAKHDLRNAPGEYADRDLLDMALFHWNRLVEARLAMKEREPFECICPTCGLRHGVSDPHPGTF